LNSLLKADKRVRSQRVRLVPIVLQKSPSRLCEIEICNNRIGASVLLNRCCSFVPDLESMFRDQMQKILLQHNLPKAAVTHRSNKAPLFDHLVCRATTAKLPRPNENPARVHLKAQRLPFSAY